MEKYRDDYNNEMYLEEEFDYDNDVMWKIYGSAFIFIVLIIIPWVIGVFTLGRWIFF